jgi:hypothetical protein
MRATSGRGEDGVLGCGRDGASYPSFEGFEIAFGLDAGAWPPVLTGGDWRARGRAGRSGRASLRRSDRREDGRFGRRGRGTTNPAIERPDVDLPLDARSGLLRRPEPAIAQVAEEELAAHLALCHALLVREVGLSYLFLDEGPASSGQLPWGAAPKMSASVAAVTARRMQ